MTSTPEQQRLTEIKADIRDHRGSAPALYSIALSVLAELRDSKSAAEALNADVSHLGRKLEQAQARERGLEDAVENLIEDVDKVKAEDLRLHDLESKIGAVYLGYGGGWNHDDDLREALAAQSEGSDD